MKKLRWATDCSGYWDLDLSTPVTLEATARPLPSPLLPLGLSRGVQLARPKQLAFFHNFMSMPFVPSYSPADGFSLHRALSLPPLANNWFAALLGQFKVHKFVSSIQKVASFDQQSMSAWFKDVGAHLCNTSLYALGFCAEYLIAPDCSLLVNSEAHDDNTRGFRNKIVLRQRLPGHNLTIEGVWPGLFVDHLGEYWNVPSSVNVDLASHGFDSGLNYHVCVQHNSGTPKLFGDDQSNGSSPPILQPGLCIKSAFTLKKDAEIWQSETGKLRMVQPYDILLSDPHVQVSGVLGAAAIASIRRVPENVSEENQSDAFTLLKVYTQQLRPAILADFFSSFSCTAQLGNFQRLLFDITRLSVRFNIHSGSTFLKSAAHLTREFYNSEQLSPHAIRGVCPDMNISFQQQIVGPFSVRADSRLTLDLNENGRYGARVDDSVIALEYALKVLGSGKATAWYSIKKREAMIELRFFES